MGRFAAKAAQGKFSNKVITTYKAYLDNPEIAKQEHPVTNRPASKPLYIRPFSLDLAASQLVKVSASETVITARLGAVNTGGNRAMATLSGTDSAFRLARFRPAKALIVTGVKTTGTREVSKTSGLPYKYYGGERTSIPFGQKSETETITEAFAAIYGAIRGTNPTAASPKVTLMPERYSP